MDKDENRKSPAKGEGLSEFRGSFNNIKREDTKFLHQKKRVFKAFFGPPKSMLQVAIETDIFRSNLCWYLNDWLKTKSIQRVKTGFCPITKRKVGKYSTNPMYWEKKGGKNGR